jgi:ATP-dependent protease ClpP protease subunit
MRAANQHNLRALALAKVRFLDRVTNLNPTLAHDLRNLQLPWYYIRNADAPPVEPDEDDGKPMPPGKGGKKQPPKEEPAAEIFIYDEIGGSAGVSADDFVKDLNEIDAENIMLRINSPGGSVFDAIAIYNALIQHPANVTVRVDALAASAASIVAMAGDTVEMMVGSQLMIHDALGMEQGNAKEMREMAAFLDKQSDNIASIYAARTGDQSEEAIKNWRNLMLAETWMFAQEAVECGLADQVYMKPQPGESLEAEVPDEPMDEEPEEDSEGDTADEASDDEIVNQILGIRHRVTARNYKYAGRRRAPAPPTNLVSASAVSFADLVNW